MGRFFPVTPKAGKPLSMRGLARGLARLEFAFSNMRVYNGRVDWSGLDVPTLSFGDDGGGSCPQFINNVKEIVGDGGVGYPYGPKYPFGIAFVADALIVWSGKLYHGWREIDWAGPADPAAPTPQVTGLTDGQTVYIRYAISTHAVDFVAASSYAEQAGYVLRALVTVGVAGGRAYMAKWWGGGLDTGLMGDRS